MRMIFLLFGGGEGGVDKLLIYVQQLNDLESNIIFTFELETYRRLPFLNVEIKREENELIRSVYRKTTANLNIIYFSACTPFSYKLSNFRFLINKAFKTFFVENLRDEFHKIKKR